MSEQKCIICNQPTNKCLNITFSRISPDGEHRGSGRFYACGEHSELVRSLSVEELELFMRQNEPLASSLLVKERAETSGQAEIPFEPQRTHSNGNGLTRGPDPDSKTM